MVGMFDRHKGERMSERAANTANTAGRTPEHMSRHLSRREVRKRMKAALALFLAVILVTQSSHIEAIAQVLVEGQTTNNEVATQQLDATTTGDATTTEGQEPAEEPAEDSTTATSSESATETKTDASTTATKDDAAKDTTKSDAAKDATKAPATDTTTDAKKDTSSKAPAADSSKPADTTATDSKDSTDTTTNTKVPAKDDTTPAKDTTPTEATLKLDLANSRIAYITDGAAKDVAKDQKTLTVPTAQDLKFTVTADDDFEVMSVKTVVDDKESDPLKANDDDEYKISADDLADGMTIKVETEAVPEEEPETDQTPADDNTINKDDETQQSDTEKTDDAEKDVEETTGEKDDESVTLSVEVENSTVTLTNAEGEEQKVSESQDVEVAADEDLALTVEPAEDYELESVTVTDVDETSEVSGEDGVYTIPADQVIEGSNIQVSAVNAAKAQGARATSQTLNVDDQVPVRCTNNDRWHDHSWTSSNSQVATVTTNEDGWGIFAEQRANQTVTAVAPGDAEIKCGNTVILTVHVEVSEIAVNFDPNGGQGEHFTKTTSEIENGNYRMSLPTLEESGFSRDGYTFVGWSTDRTGEGQTYTPQEITVSDGQTYYAIWAKDNAEGKVYAEFFLRIKGDIPYEPDANIGGGGAGYFPGGCGTGMSGSIKQAVAINNNNALVAANINEAPSDATIQAEIQEWNRTHTSENRMSYDPDTQEIVWYVIKKSGDHYHVDGVIVDKAEHWVSYNPNGGTSHVPTGKQYMEGATVDVDFTAIPSKAGYTFLGWDTDSSATTPTYTEGGTNSFEMPANNITLYAIWQEKDAVVYTYTADPVEGGTLSNSRDSVKPDTGEPKGSTPTANEYYEFAGWYNSNGEKITTENAAANGVKLEGDTLTPIKNGEGVFTGGSFTAKFTQVTFEGNAITVKVEKDGTPASVDGVVKATEYTDGGGTDNFNVAPDGDNLKITYTYDNLNCADIALAINVPEGYDVEVESNRTGDTVGTVDNTKVAKFELKGSGGSWTLDNVPGGATVTVKLTKKSFTVNYVAEDGGQVDPKSETVKYGENAKGSVATPNDGYYFVNWTDAEGAQVSTDANFAPQSVKESATYTAHFAKKMEVSITGKSATELIYDGSEQSVSGFEDETADGVPVHVDGQTYFVRGATSTASGTNAMDEAVDTTINADKLQVFDANGNNVTNRFTVAVNPGQFKINPVELTVKANDASRTYNGTPLTESGYQIVSGKFVRPRRRRERHHRLRVRRGHPRGQLQGDHPEGQPAHRQGDRPDRHHGRLRPQDLRRHAAHRRRLHLHPGRARRGRRADRRGRGLRHQRHRRQGRQQGDLLQGHARRGRGRGRRHQELHLRRERRRRALHRAGVPTLAPRLS